ncbi:phytoene/squalene synthase family protein [Acidithrix sp. C25]|uniref:phytoene/squalene synthase family protein n=1 Tax=Acidithrix sp. C25 TaxID=1671482 RepID=UPI00191BB63F|nr:phytoene/squalene synthase family protein [Acidithrix sp. C25]CAG4918842.1 unnamed protein product [Acidithrix sp. C25]
MVTQRELDGSYERCRSLNMRFGKSYYYSTFLLPQAMRRHIHALYGFCRYADDIVDDLGDVPISDRESALGAFVGRFFSDVKVGFSNDPILMAVVDTVLRFEIDLDLFSKFAESMRLDFSKFRYETYEDLLTYMEGSAAVIGEMTLPVLEPSSKYARKPARDLGFAFQLTNFLRDVSEDLQRGRIYIPLEDIEQFKAMSAFETRRSDFEFRELMQFEIARNREIYEQSRLGDRFLPPRSAACVAGARELYSGILEEIELVNFDVFGSRVSVAPWKKFRVAIGAIVG